MCKSDNLLCNVLFFSLSQVDAYAFVATKHFEHNGCYLHPHPPFQFFSFGLKCPHRTVRFEHITTYLNTRNTHTHTPQLGKLCTRWLLWHILLFMREWEVFISLGASHACMATIAIGHSTWPLNHHIYINASSPIANVGELSRTSSHTCHYPLSRVSFPSGLYHHSIIHSPKARQSMD